LIYYKYKNFATANKLLELGANINVMDSKGNFATKYALKRKDTKEIERLVKLGANIN